ncbi:hypothetical protein SLA2020_381650 [Shorea laevis]
MLGRRSVFPRPNEQTSSLSRITRGGLGSHPLGGTNSDERVKEPRGFLPLRVAYRFQFSRSGPHTPAAHGHKGPELTLATSVKREEVFPIKRKMKLGLSHKLGCTSEALCAISPTCKHQIREGAWLVYQE